MTTFLVDDRAAAFARDLLPENVQVQIVDCDDRSGAGLPDDRPVLGALSLAGQGDALRARLAESPLAGLEVIELDPDRPETATAMLIGLLAAELSASTRHAGEARLSAAQLRAENIAVKTQLRDIENLLYSLGNPQFSNALSWQPTGRLLPLGPGQAVTQALPMNAVSIAAVDLWFPEVVLPIIERLAVEIEDAAGTALRLQATSPDTGIETGWIRFALPEPISGPARDCRLRIGWTGKGAITLGLGLAVPDPRFRATVSAGPAPEETLAVQVWKSLGGVRLPPCAPAVSSGLAVSVREARFVPAAALPRPEIFASPPLASDHVSTAYWENEDAILVHPSRVGAVCAILRDVDLAGLSHVSALVTVGHSRSPNLNFAVGVAPHGAVDEDGFWQRRMGPWVAGLPAHGWAQAHCIPVEPIAGRADLLLAVSLASDSPNDLSWGLFRGFRFARGAAMAEAEA